MTPIEICEHIVSKGDCGGIRCRLDDCPLDAGEYYCDDSQEVAQAKRYLADHKVEEKTKTDHYCELYDVAVPEGYTADFRIPVAGELALSAHGLVRIGLPVICMTPMPVLKKKEPECDHILVTVIHHGMGRMVGLICATCGAKCELGAWHKPEDQ